LKDNKYKKAIEHVQVTDEMRTRILNNIKNEFMKDDGNTSAGLKQEKKPSGIIRFSGYIKIAALAACFALIVTCAVVIPKITKKGTAETEVKTQATSEPDAQGDLDGGNLSYTGIMSFKSAEELSSEAGFEISDFDESLLPFSVTQKNYSYYGDGLAEIEYDDAGGGYAAYRKSSENDGADISGDYTDYEDTWTLKSDNESNLKITVKGNNGMYFLAAWNDGTYTYSFNISKGLSKDDMEKILNGITA
jgi:hypothetical protein